MKHVRVIIVEDEPLIASILEDRLTEMGYEVSGIFANGKDAIVFFNSHPSDLILMDVHLEGPMDGIETAQKMTQFHPTPVIFLTNNSDDTTFDRAKNTMPAAFLSKPFRDSDLKHTIELAISRAAKSTSSPKSENAEDRSYLFKDRLFIKIKDRMVRVFLNEILWVEADDYYCKIITKDKQLLVGQTLKQLGENLENLPEFLRVHRSYIVNLSHIEAISDNHLFIGKQNIPISKTAKEELSRSFPKA